MATLASINSKVVTQDQFNICRSGIETHADIPINWDDVIGQGTYGIILGTNEDEWVVKVANKKGQCRTMDHEYKLHNDANIALSHVKTHANIPIFCPDTRGFSSYENCCWYYMTKILKDTSHLVHCLILHDPDSKTETGAVFFQRQNIYLITLKNLMILKK